MKLSDPSWAGLVPESTAELTPSMDHLLTFVPNPSLEGCAECKISVRSQPYLADHAFQDMIVLPGSFYIEMALSVHQEFLERAPGVVRNVTFQNPVVLSLDDTVIRVEVRSNGGDTAEYRFYEGAVDNGGGPPRRQYAAKLEIDRSPSALQESADESFSIEEFQAQADDVIDSERFYKELRVNGNQYGPRFQGVSSIWRAGNEALGKLSWRHAESEFHCLHPTLLDSTTQMLAPFMMAGGRTFILRSIKRIEIANLDFPDTLWCHATLLETEGESKDVVGNVRVFGPSGKLHLQLSGVAFNLLDHPDALEENTAPSLVVASNFTADPLEDSLKFWAAYFGLQAKIEFAPYDQIFQQLLQAESVFRKNSHGVNIILLQLERWAAAERDHVPTFDKERAERCFGKRKRRILPNGLEVVHLNEYETDYLYKEIFEDECYLKHGVRLPDGATVVDIGANIGLFSLFVMSRCRNPKIFAFEPAPVAFDILKANCEAYGSSGQVFNFGVSDRKGRAPFTFYENSSVFSSFHSGEAEDREAIQAVVRNMLEAGSVGDESLQEFVDELTTDRLRRTTHECGMTSVSDIIRENRIEKIDLLKIDAEKSELDIIKGIAECDWAKIDQIAIEIHDPTREAARRVNDLLVGKGYRCAIEQEKLLEHSGLFNLFATRNQLGNGMGTDSTSRQSVSPPRMSRSGSLQRNVGDFCSALQSFTSQTQAPVVLCVCPASPAVEANAELKVALADAERELLSRTGALAGVSTIGSEALARRYPVAEYEYYDVHGHQLGDIPYTAECYAAIGTTLFRTIFSLKRKPFKVIVLDCDNTLWKGVCGEDGPSGVAVTEPYRALQEFVVGQMNAGMLLCLCSKNSEKDVLDVFDQRVDMLLRREHIASWRINWSSKSENIKSLASELNLALDSFIFIDDNPVDCADVEINCPGVLTLQVPREPASFASFFENIWAFDHTETTEEDRTRTRMYQENAQRESFRAQTPSLNDFVADLLVRVEMAEATEDQLNRVSQLTFRTSQFNFTSIRRSESEIRDFLKRPNTGCLVVRVADRFGDYGLVGVVIYETEADRFKLDTFLLSCRVLGRGVEHRVLSMIGQRALSSGKRFVELTCLTTERNLPAREFISSLGDGYRNKKGESRIFPAEYLASLQYNPDEKTRQGNDKLATTPRDKPPLPPMPGFCIPARSEHFQRIGEGLYDISRVAKAISEFRLRTKGIDEVAETEPAGSLETVILNIWRKVLGRPGIGLNVNFFEAGGTSLKAVQVIAMIRKEVKQNLSVISLFECPTVRLLAARLSAPPESLSDERIAAGAALRGQQRRFRAMRRTQ